ncbi:MAG: RNA polymerase sigma factor [Steroidobacteraceae bacterium]
MTAEQQLVQAMCRGDEAAFDRFFRDYAPRLYRFVLPRARGDESLTEEICQETLGRAMQRIGGWRGEASLFTWLCQIARNQLTDHWRRTAQRERFEVLSEDNPQIAAAVEAIEVNALERPESQSARAELLRLVQVALDRLPMNYGNALEWKYIDGFSVAEIATRLQLNPVATQSLLARARLAFRDIFSTLAGADAADSRFEWEDATP